MWRITGILFIVWYVIFVSSRVLLVLPVTNQSAAVQTLQILNRLPIQTTFDLITCNEDHGDFFNVHRVNIHKKYYSRFLCNNNIDQLTESSTFDEMIESLRKDVLRSSMLLLNDFDIFLSSISTSQFVVTDFKVVNDKFMAAVHKIVESLIVTSEVSDILRTEGSIRVWHHVNRPRFNYIDTNGQNGPSYLNNANGVLSDIASTARKNLLAGLHPDRDCNCRHNASSFEPKCYSLDNLTLSNLQHFQVHSNAGASSAVASTISGAVSTSSKKLLLCMVYTISTRHNNLRAIVDTWGKRCDGFLAWSNETDFSLSSVYIYNWRLNGTESYDGMWYKVIGIWEKIAASRLIDEYEYFYLCGDDVYVLVNNLRHFLTSDFLKRKSGNGRSGQYPLYLGRRHAYNHYLNYNTGESGYVLNALAVKMLVQNLKSPQCFYDIKVSMEDVMVANCLLSTIGLRPMDTRDDLGRERFLTINFTTMFEHGNTTNRYEAQLKNFRLALDGYSEYSISFHRMIPNDYMYCIDQYFQSVTP